MTTLNTTAQRKAEIVRIKQALNTTNNDRVLSALGHPGYGHKHATKVLGRWASTEGLTLHQCAYGTYS